MIAVIFSKIDLDKYFENTFKSNRPWNHHSSSSGDVRTSATHVETLLQYSVEGKCLIRIDKYPIG